MGYVDQTGGRTAAVVDTEHDLGALVRGPGAVEDAGVQLSDEGRFGEPADNVRAGLGAVSEDTEHLAAITQPYAGDQCVIRELGGLARLGLGVHKTGKVFSGSMRTGPEILLGQ